MSREHQVRHDHARGPWDSHSRHVAAVDSAHAECAARIRELHDQNTSLVQLTVASQLLCGAVEREDVLSAIEEVVVNMIGSEEFAILDLDTDSESLRVARLKGIDAHSPRLARAAGSLHYARRTGEIFIPRGRQVRHDDQDGGLTVAIPLRVEHSVTGIVAIFRLLEQKTGLDPTDHDLFEVLSRQAAMALHSAAFRSLRVTVRPPTRSR
jgi:hypothetical protein